MKRIISVALIVALVILGTACSPTDVGVGQFPRSAQPVARCIVKRESGGDPRAISPTHDYGLFQINRKAHKRNFEARYGVAFEKGALDPRLNGKYARYLYDYYRSHGGTGWEPWAGGRYRCF